MIDQATVSASTEFSDMMSMFRACVVDHPEAIALYYFDRSVSYAELDAQSDALACWLLDQGIRADDRVAIILQNVPQFVMMTVAAWKIAAIPLPVNPMYRTAELSRIFIDAEPKVALCFTGQAADVGVAAKQAGLAMVIMATAPYAFQSRNDHRLLMARDHADTPDVPMLETILSEATGVKPPQVELGGETTGLLLYTSGTTGLPKGAMIRHSNLSFNAQTLRDGCALGTESRILGIAPLFHITGFSCHITAAFSARAGVILHYRVEPTLLLDVIRKHRPTYTIGAITVFNALSNVPGVTHADMACFNRIYSGGAPIPPALLLEIEERLGIKIHPCYGMTETTAPTHLAPHMATIPVDPTSGALSIGKLVPGTSAKIVDEHGHTLAPGEVGELVVKGPQIMKGYWRKPDETAATLKDGWMHTGDVAFVDDGGWFFLVDRIKDVIIASGFKIWPREVEDVLYAHPAVREAAVIGVPDNYRGETVKAFVSLKDNFAIDCQTLIDHCGVRLAAYKVPRSIEILVELPKTITGKIQRLALRP
jgi:long-chain acyl-CoA synthetase